MKLINQILLGKAPDFFH